MMSMQPDLNHMINSYRAELNKGQIQKAYRGIMTFMAQLRVYQGNRLRKINL